MVSSRASTTLAILLACVAAAALPPLAYAIDAKCSACEAVAYELQDALNSERPRNHLDMRGRLDSKGNRLGRMIDYKVSELRFVELLEGLCETVGSYKLREATDDEPKHWTVSGKAVRGAKGKAMRAEIEGYCARLVEQEEEELQATLYAGKLNDTNVEEYMCYKLSKECKGNYKKKPEKKEEPAAEASTDKKKSKKKSKKGGKDAKSAEFDLDEALKQKQEL